MALLARDCPLPQALGIQTWLSQLLYIAADAAAMKHWKLASQVGPSICAYEWSGIETTPYMELGWLGSFCVSIGVIFKQHACLLVYGLSCLFLLAGSLIVSFPHGLV